MKSLRLFVLAFVLALCASASGYYEELWRSENELGPPTSIHIVGIGNTDFDPAPELIYIASEPWDRGYVFIWALNLLTGETYEVTDEFYDIVILPGKEPRLVDINNNGTMEILFLGAESPSDAYQWYMYGFIGTSGARGPAGYRRLSGPQLIGSRPNPVRRSARVEYQIPKTGDVNLRIYDASGRLVRELVNGRMEAGRHSAEWQRDNAQGRPVAAGTYFYVLESDGREVTRKAIVVE